MRTSLDRVAAGRYPVRVDLTPRRPVLPPLPAVLVAIVSVQGGAALAKGLFPVFGPAGTVGLRIVLDGAAPGHD